MALIKCTECGNEVSTTAKTCPKCGAKVKLPRWPDGPVSGSQKFQIGLAAVIVIVFLIIIMSGSEQSLRTEAKHDAEQREKNFLEGEKIAQLHWQENMQKGVEKRKAAEAQRIAALSPAQRASEERVAKERAAAAAKAAAEQARIVEQDKRFGERPHQSEYDGSYSAVERYLKKVMNDPDSLKMAGCTKVFRTTDGWLVGCDYRGRNGFGGLIKVFNWFTIRQDHVVQMHDESAYSR